MTQLSLVDNIVDKTVRPVHVENPAGTSSVINVSWFHSMTSSEFSGSTAIGGRKSILRGAKAAAMLHARLRGYRRDQATFQTQAPHVIRINSKKNFALLFSQL
jgi:hypothetical protein